jgi:hypothetical protein
LMLATVLEVDVFELLLLWFSAEVFAELKA